MTRHRLVLAVLSAIVLAGCGSSTPTHTASDSGNGGPTQPGGGHMGPEGIPIERGPALAPASTTAPGIPVNGIQCAPSEQVAYHIHSHLQVYVDGSPRQIPGGIGILEPAAEHTPEGPFYAATRCYYWLHTHTADGIIHIESPTARIYTLGDFFGVWRQPLSTNVVATAQGQVTAFFNGKHWTKSPRVIPLLPHGEIQLDVGKPVVGPREVSFEGSGL